MLGYILTLGLVVCCWTVQADIQCYQCATTNSSGACVTDTQGLVNSSVGIGNKYIKNCTKIRNDLDRCMILYKEVNKNIVVYNRDCHNGTYFPEDYYSPLFDNVNPINQTVCDVIKDSFVCYRSCKTSFCNGPQPGPCDFYRANNSYPISDDLECGAAYMFVKSGPVTTDLLCLIVASFALLSISSVT
ncbi:hypothetical protein BsWGS_26444 [Bradybaena similaris]